METTYLENIKKANSTMAFLRRNLKSCPEQCKKSAFISLVRSNLDNSAIILGPLLYSRHKQTKKNSKTGGTNYYWRL